jgi:hypothetical protein
VDSPDPHNRTVDALRGVLEFPAVSLVSGLIDCEVFNNPLVASADAVGLGTTDGVMVADAVLGVAWVSEI